MELARISFRVKVPLNTQRIPEVWARLRDVEHMPMYWHGHREVVVIESSGNEYLARVKFAFPAPGKLNVGLAKITIDENDKSITINHLKGPVRGVVKAWIDEDSGTIACEYDVRVSAWQVPFKWWVRRHFMRGVAHALERITSGRPE